MGWDKGANKWQLQELMQTQLQFTAGNVLEDGTVVATNCYCFYTADQGPLAEPGGCAVARGGSRQGAGGRRSGESAVK